MMKVVYSANFFLSVKKLPPATQTKLAACLDYLAVNPFHPLLHTKRLSGPLAGLLSFRITRDWRVVFQFLASETIHLLRAAHRKDVYRD